MKHAILAAAVVLTSTAFASSAAARSDLPLTFTSAQSFQKCSENWVFACGKVDRNGRRYGTAHKRTMCSTYTFLASGEATLEGYPGLPEQARYHIRGGTVHIEVLDKKTKKVTRRLQLPLSKDGKSLGEMKRIEL
jgi:hypothetical protein